MFCRYCGKEIEDNAKFCNFCGKKIEDDVEIKKNNEPSKRNIKLIIAIIVGVVLCAIIFGLGVFSLKDKPKTEDEFELPTEEQTLLDDTTQEDTGDKEDEAQMEAAEIVMKQFLSSLQAGDIENVIAVCSSAEYQYYSLMNEASYNKDTVSMVFRNLQYDMSEAIISATGLYWSVLTPYCELYEIDNSDLQTIKMEFPFIEKDCESAYWAVAGYQTNSGEKVYRLASDVLLVKEKEEWVVAGCLPAEGYEQSDSVMEPVHSMMLIIENSWVTGGSVDCASYIVQREFGTHAVYFSKKALIWDYTKQKVNSMSNMYDAYDVVTTVNYNFDLACTDYISLNWTNVQDIVEQAGGICLDGSMLSQIEINLVNEAIDNVSDSEKEKCELVWNKIKNSELITADEIEALHQFYRPMLRSAHEYRFSKLLTQALIDIFKKDNTIIISDEVFNNCSTSYSKEELAKHKWESLDRQMFVYSDGEYKTISRFGKSLVVDDYTSLPMKMRYKLFDKYEYIPTENINDIQEKMMEFLSE